MLRTIGVYPSAPLVLRLNTKCAKHQHARRREQKGLLLSSYYDGTSLFTKIKRTIF